MCGIAGIVYTDRARPVEGEFLRAMCGALVHRGPDDEGVSLDGNVGIGMRRLSVIDVDGGAQPIANEQDTCRIVYNGEVYNSPALREELRSKGHRFSTASDTETIVHLYEDLGDDCVQPLNGMFAFAVHDRRRNRVLLARDRLGVKPLYYADLGDTFLFASEIKALLAHPAFDSEIDLVGLDQYLANRYIPAPRTIFSRVKKLPPGHVLTWSDGRIDVRRYWKLSYADRYEGSEIEASRELLERVDQAVRGQMLSDVPLGALLSGGIDSSLIVALMARASGRPVKTFSIGFDERSYNELPHARAVARAFGTEHHEEVVRPDVTGLFERVVAQFDEPFGDSSAVPTYLVSELARRHVTVALSGTGADELFAGYERYRAVPLARWASRAPSALLRPAAWCLNRLPSGYGKRSVVHRASRFLASLNDDPLLRHRSVTGLFAGSERRSTRAESDAPFAGIWSESDAPSELERLLDLDTQTILADDYLVKDDRMSMAHSLELRVPFLDHTLVEFAASLPARVKLKGLETKSILKRAAADVLPDSILKRPKHGFEIPIASWIAGDLRTHAHDLLTSPSSTVPSLLPPGLLSTVLEEHVSGRSNHASRLWSLMTLEMWLRNSGRQRRNDPSLVRRG